MPALGRSSWPRWARVATSPWLLSPVLVLTLLAGSFLAYGAYSRSKTTHYARGGASFYSDDSGSRPPEVPTPSASKADKAAVHAGKGGPKPPQGAGRSPVPARGSVASSGGSTSGGGTESGSSGGGRSSDAVAPRTGTYRLSVSGSEHVKFGPFSACTNAQEPGMPPVARISALFWKIMR